MPALCDELILYGTDACHLCEQAEELLNNAIGAGLPAAYEKVDISQSELLFERYGVRIPVLRRGDGAELGWPFDHAQLRQFLNAS
ncbi:glutaredoxin family protein [Kineobactrum salinum]|uniref:Glutaredoxin family protein n=1 Tax=Kineobactrum salinum TaxID=2708301 RepID=A0A6C0U5F0_9GAMM|nr:glutaredoxin family protein [Kineobactrum salinum]QIB67341.1 glutaredoxin family protein [Kineobactrum salinum]